MYTVVQIKINRKERDNGKEDENSPVYAIQRSIRKPTAGDEAR
jgi:hypothetical protein